MRFPLLVCGAITILILPETSAAQTPNALGAAVLSSATQRSSPSGWAYQVGARTTFMLSPMRLHRLGAPFADLEAGGSDLTHASSLFVLWPRWRDASLGIETLVGNSYGSRGSQILFQAAGLSIDYRTRARWFAALGSHLGGMIASATYTPQPSNVGDVQSGAHYKGSGLFLAPAIALGRDAGAFELRVLVRRVINIPGTRELGAFDATYVGLSASRKLR